jgi:ubiquinol-cytochrome c reductase iron-sulfur subunit
MGHGGWVRISFIVSFVASIALVILYFFSDSAQIEGALLAVALGGMGLGIVGWATTLMNITDRVEEREVLASDEESRHIAQAALEEGDITRRKALIRLLAGAGATLGAALAIPALSLGPRPGDSLFRTQWRAGLRVVTIDGDPLSPTDIPLDGIVTAFPEGFANDAESQALIIHLSDPGSLRLTDDRANWVPDGCIAYSKICTHAGCPVGLYRAQAQQLLCPCHQSTFDVLAGAAPVFGPTARALPQLPLDVDDDGFLVALGDFTEPVGPSFWDLREGNDRSIDAGGG